MKITFNIDCTPQEARAFFGLPDVAPMQQRMMKEMEAQMRKNLAGADMDNLFKNFLTGAGGGLERWQEMFWKAAKPGKDSD